MAEYWNKTYPQAPEGARIHFYEGEDDNVILMRALVEYEMDGFFGNNEQVLKFANDRLQEVRKQVMEKLGLDNNGLEKRIRDFLTVYDGSLNPQNEHYGDWIRKGGIWVRQNNEELATERNNGIRYYNKYMKYKLKYISLKKEI